MTDEFAPPVGGAPDAPRMPEPARRVQRIYLALEVLSTLAASFIWGINTLFLLDAGLTNAQAFGANAFFTVGQVLFEVPTGVVADTWGRRTSYLLGVVTLLLATLLYLVMWQTRAPFFGWAIASVLLGLGFTFFSGATEAWLVDALAFHDFKGNLETVMARGQTAAGVAMLAGSFMGGAVAQVSNLGVPYLLRTLVLAVTFAVAFLLMKDVGFTPARRQATLIELRRVVRNSLDQGWRRPPVRWLMLAAPFTMGVGMYAFYAMQPYLLQLYGDQHAFAIAGLAAAVVAGTQIVGGLMVPLVRRLFSRRTQALLLAAVVAAASLAIIGMTTTFWVAVALLVAQQLAVAVTEPMRQAYLNGIIPSAQRATILSFDNLMGSAGGVVLQPALGRVADGWGYGRSYVIGAAVQLVAIPFLVVARRQNVAADVVDPPRPPAEPRPS